MTLPYLSLLAIAIGDALAVGQRVSGGHLGVAAQLMPVIAAVLLGVAPWRVTTTSWSRRTTASAAATVIAALAASAATLVVIGNGLAGAPGVRRRARRSGRRRGARAGRAGLHARQGERGRPRDMAGVQPDKAVQPYIASCRIWFWLGLSRVQYPVDKDSYLLELSRYAVLGEHAGTE